MGQIINKVSSEAEKEFISVSTEEIEWLTKKFPKLKYVEGTPSKIEGLLEFEASYDGNEIFIVEPPEHLPNSVKNVIVDAYNIEIHLIKNEYSSLPQIKETGNRIIKYAASKRKPLIDFHINEKTGTLCLIESQMEAFHLPNGFNLSDYLFRLVIPFLYAHSYQEKNNSRPWGEWNHGNLGVLESYSEIREHESLNQGRVVNCIKLLKIDKNWDVYKLFLSRENGYKRQWICTCGSGNKFRKCHLKAYKGLVMLIRDFESFPEIKTII